MDTIKGMKRTMMCGCLREEHIGSEVVLMGWVAKTRDMGGLIFVDIRDRSGISQLVFSPENAELIAKAAELKSEYVIAVRGSVRRRESVNGKIPTGMVEVEVGELRILSASDTPPFVIQDDVKAGEELRLKYRYLDLRRPEMQRTLELRHKITQIARNYYDKNGFLEIETPVLCKSTPEGARDYLVPSRIYPGRFFALPQSPQLYKQLLMLGGMDRYFQIAKCFRDEDLRADRQPEFTQLDLEMSFVDEDDVMSVNEGFIKTVFKEVLDIDVQLPLPRLTYAEAMNRFGSDKPDTRFGMELVDMTDLFKGCGFAAFADVAEKEGCGVRAINAKGLGAKLTRKTLDGLVEFVKTYRAKGLAWLIVEENEIRGSIAKFFSSDELGAIAERAGAEAGDTILFVADSDNVVFAALGALRCELAQRYGLIDKDTFKLLWVTDFPLFEYSEEERRYVAMHHPFTSPKDEDIELLDSNPAAVRAKAYDIVLNGVELGGGSIRIFDSGLQSKMFEKLGFTPEAAMERFGFLINAFRYGTPPHGGMAYGLDRMVMLMAGKPSIRDVMAFPKVKDSSEPMVESPGTVDDKQLEELGIKIAEKTE